MIVDKPHTAAQLRQFASQIEHLTPISLEELQKMVEGGQDPEFYRGLLAGMSASYVLIQNCQGTFLGPLIAVVADHMERNEII